MVGLNKTTIIGYLAADPESRNLPSGEIVSNFRVGVNSGYTDRDGQKHDDTEWFSVSAFKRLGEVVQQNLAKGRLVYVEGRLRTRQYEKDGQTQYRTDLIANEVKFLDSKGASTASSEVDAMPF